uniref:Uncharacterized protein n=1 Tax=Odontella aurita TaxID=265563 RepID=A0A6U6CRL6_9STRA
MRGQRKVKVYQRRRSLSGEAVMTTERLATQRPLPTASPSPYKNIFRKAMTFTPQPQREGDRSPTDTTWASTQDIPPEQGYDSERESLGQTDETRASTKKPWTPTFDAPPPSELRRTASSNQLPDPDNSKELHRSKKWAIG